MITAVNANNMNDYRELFAEASDILSGYRRVRTYNGEIADYYYKNPDFTSSEDLFIIPVKEGTEEPLITSLVTFSQALEEYKTLYVKEGEPVDGFEPMIGITTLEEYFSWLQNLSIIDRKYTVLPLDEEHFEINANTRAINIPASFKKNGVAVQGDDLAEVLYFKIDRYFDYMDLNNTDIFIQWEAPKDANGNQIRSVSPAYIRDIESEPGKLIFGWALSDAITATAGTLKFSVRFFDWEDKDKAAQGGEKVLAYSFSTLTASVTIQPSIQFNPETDEYEIDDVGDRLVERIENSKIVGGYEAYPPYFLTNLNNATTYDLDDETGMYTLLVQAQSADTGAISYIWKHQGLNVENKVDGQNITVLEGKNEFVVADMDNLSASRTYYYMTSEDADGNPSKPVLYKGTIPPSVEWIKKYENLYEKYSSIQADKAGVYWVTAENRITNSTSSVKSNEVRFPRPEFVRITTQPTEKGVLQSAEGVATPQTLSVVVGNTDGVLTYQWEKDENHAANFGGQATNFVAIEGATEASYVAEEPGHYRVVITNTRNKEDISDTSTYARITNFPAVPVVEYPADPAEREFSYQNLVDDIVPTVKIDPSVEYDSYEAAWFTVVDGEGVLIAEKQPVVHNDDGTITASFNPLNFEEKFEELGETIPGKYYCIITNHLNGEVRDSVKVDSTEMFLIEEFTIED